jgi:hypothetical protein
MANLSGIVKQLKKERGPSRATVVWIECSTRGFCWSLSWDGQTYAQTP